MAYIVNKYNGVAIATVQDGTVDHTTDLTFIGKNYAGYGEVQNENFLHLLENFSSTTEPPRPIEGQIWYDKTARVLKFHDGFRFKAAAVEYSSSIPTNPSLGDLWWDSTLNKLYSFSGSGERSGFQLVGPDNNVSNTSVRVRTVRDTSSNEDAVHDVVQIFANDIVVAIFNSGPAFNVLETDPIDATDPDAFRSIKQGITLRHTLNDEAHAGISFAGSSEWQLWGTASDARKLGGVSFDQFALKTGTTFTGPVTFTQAVNVKLLSITEDANQNTLITKTGPSPIKFTVNNSTNLVIGATAVSPETTGTIDLGTSTAKWKDIWASGTVTANAFTGVLTGNVKDSTGAVLLDNTTKTFKGNVLDSTANVILDNTEKWFKGSLKANDGTTAYDAATKTFSGSFTGSSDSAKSLTKQTSEVAGTDSKFPPAIQGLAYTVVVRDADGKINVSGIAGNADGAMKLYIPGVNLYKPADIAATASTIAARDTSGNLTAIEFKGVASQAYYADLAEKYVADKEYEPGTVVVIGGTEEVTACSIGEFAIGVVSKNPAYMMNSGLDNGTYIALKGRVPTKVVGAVNKGDRLIAAAYGCASANNSTANHCFGVALESNSDIAVKIVEVLVL